MEEYTTGTGQKLIGVHSKEECKSPNCGIHNPSNHNMRGFPTNWREDRQIMERVCRHGVGHPDPDDYAIQMGWDNGSHGCCGCCSKTPLERYYDWWLKDK